MYMEQARAVDPTDSELHRADAHVMLATPKMLHKIIIELSMFLEETRHQLQDFLL